MRLVLKSCLPIILILTFHLNNAFSFSDKGDYFSLTGIYKSEDGGVYFVNEKDGLIYCFGEHKSGSWAFVFRGNRYGFIVAGTYTFLPKGKEQGHGHLDIGVSENRIEILSEKNPFKGRSWERISNLDFYIPVKTKGEFGNHNSLNNVTGIWQGDDGASYYVVERDGEVFWFGESHSKNSSGRPSLANLAFGKRQGNIIELDWVSSSKGPNSSGGKLILSVISREELHKELGSNGFAGSNWKRGKNLEMNIRGYYKGNDTGDYMIDQLSNGTIYWIGEAPDGSWTNIFWGKVNGRQIIGDFYDVPKGNFNGKGTLILNVSSDRRSINKENGSSPFGGSIWNRGPKPKNLVPSVKKSGFGRDHRITGTWIGDDGRIYYFLQVGNKVFWFAEEDFSEGRPRWASIGNGIIRNNSIFVEWSSSFKGSSYAPRHGVVIYKFNSQNELIKTYQDGPNVAQKLIKAERFSSNNEADNSFDEQNSTESTEKMSFLPNPFVDEIFLEFEKEFGLNDVELLGSDGKSFHFNMKKRRSGSKEKITLSGLEKLSPGHYIIKALGEQSIKVIKVIKN